MKSLLILPLTLLLAAHATAADLTVLAGYQYNWDFKVSDEAGEVPGAAAAGEPGDDVELKGGAVLGLAMDFVFMGEPNQRLGFILSHSQANFDSGSGLQDRDMDITHLHFTGTSLYPDGNWEPFVQAGIGATRFAPADSSLRDTTRFSMQIATGSSYRLTDNLLLRLEARWIPVFFSSDSAGICSGGCTIAIKSDIYSQFQFNAGLTFRF